MPLNDPTKLGSMRSPRHLVYANGQLVAGMVRLTVDNNAHYMADTFTMTLAANGQAPGMGADWWTAQTTVLLEIYVGFPVDPLHYGKNELQHLLTAQVDKIEYNPVGGAILLSGRDLTARFIDTKTTEKFQNLTASQIVTQLAARHGLQAMVTPTSDKVGTYYQIDHARMQAGRTEWDLLTFLAQEEHFNLWVEGQTLHFAPPPDASSAAYVLNWTKDPAGGPPRANFEQIHFERALTIANDVIVHVRSWHGKAKQAYTKTAKAQHTKRTQANGGSAQEYWFTYPGQTPEWCQQKANALLKEISAHEMKLTATLPGDNLLTTRCVVQVTGTGTAFDQLYYPMSVKREFSVEGYSMHLDAKNHSPDSEVSS